MARLIKRYGGGSRKLYDFQESRYVSLDEIAGWIRAGEWVQVRDSRSGRDVTAQTLAQVIYERERRGEGEGAEGDETGAGLLHDFIRRSGAAISSGVDRLMRVSLDGWKPVRDAREEMAVLSRCLSRLERSLAQLERRHARRHAHR